MLVSGKIVMNRLMTAALVVVLWAGVSGSVGQREWSFPNTKKNGRATVEYRHEGFHFVANYDYSQRNHATRWLLIDLAAASKRRFVLHKNNIRLLTPDGRELPVAPHQAFIDDSPGVQLVVQNAQAWRRPIESYFSQRSRLEALRFQVFPGRGTTSDEAIVDDDRVALGGVFFRAPAAPWVAGTYRLAIDHELGKAALPITLE